LVLAVRAGDQEAFVTLLRRHESSILRLCRRLLGPGSCAVDAEDVTQEAFVRAFVDIDRLRRPDAFASWVHAIAANLAAKALRARRYVALDALAELRAQDDSFGAVAWRESLFSALADLSTGQREAVVAHLAGFSYGEIARRSGVPVSTVRGRVSRSRAHLRAALGSDSDGRKEIPAMELVSVCPAVYGNFRRSTDRVLVLKEVEGTRELAIRLSAADAAALEVALSGSELPEGAPHDLSLRLLRGLNARVECATVRDIGDGDIKPAAFVATLTVKGRDADCDVLTDVAAAIALAAASQAAVVVPEDVFERRGWDPADVVALRRRDAEARRRLLRLVQRGRVPTPVSPPVLPPDVDRAVAAVLQGLAASPGVWVVLLKHESGALQGWRGNGEESLLAVHTAASTGDDNELAELTTDVVYPSALVRGGVRFERVARAWQLEVAVAEDWPQSRWDAFEPSFAAARDELDALLTRPR
jgi:RNA polymerase sigma-70 factor (ECF subfamily)